ncbi:aminotransferase class I/II-fold pyridoxal phosphate-dependent enzyme [Saccharibacillus sp. JS10]|uniref:aminotransferase class I/II-fold pyridoxal phosphate-dependent enzyme n=1 Tax=Saccharibacillus sp. JS10 TaxID=2950552 RepID=UPI00210ACE90|nr:aminotransferase class I/II-fold pyridoxal phosphate-dependent enzyme [Saccharibacillus sp. JS10]MCQ4088935.1 aminotransferase class I/II-fold pyridoxal phosphate-dependent enzyme [Saccharibacillus sp. JS10]
MRNWNTDDAPLYTELLRYASRRDVSFHVPGHKDGNFYTHKQGSMPYGFSEMLSIDVTEIEGTDDLHDPEGVIKEAQQKAAAFWDAEESFFLVGGSTVGNLALLLTVCSEPGSLLIVQRNVHKSIINGLMLAGAQAVFVSSDHEPSSQLPVTPHDVSLEQALKRYPQAKGVFITRPNYYGMGRDIRQTSELCHQYGVPLLVDEAHGAHYGLHPHFPTSAIQAGADGVVQSTHKMLTAMTMGAMLHVRGDRIDRDLLKTRLAMVQSSSPSYPIMASLDMARSVAEQQGEDTWKEALEAAAYIRNEIRKLNRFEILGPTDEKSYTEQDPFKIVIYDVEHNLNGYELQRKLQHQGCVAEMSDEHRTVLALGPGTTMSDAIRLMKTLKQIQDESDPDLLKSGLRRDQQNKVSAAAETFSTDEALLISEPVSFHLHQAQDVQSVKIEQAIGEICAEMIVPYPPGIPLVYAGEIVSRAAVTHLLKLRSAGARFQGSSDPSLQTIRVRKTK